MVLGFVREAVSHLLYETVQATGNVAGGRMSCLEAALRSLGVRNVIVGRSQVQNPVLAKYVFLVKAPLKCTCTNILQRNI